MYAATEMENPGAVVPPEAAWLPHQNQGHQCSDIAHLKYEFLEDKFRTTFSWPAKVFIFVTQCK